MRSLSFYNKRLVLVVDRGDLVLIMVGVIEIVEGIKNGVFLMEGVKRDNIY